MWHKFVTYMYLKVKSCAFVTSSLYLKISVKKKYSYTCIYYIWTTWNTSKLILNAYFVLHDWIVSNTNGKSYMYIVLMKTFSNLNTWYAYWKTVRFFFISHIITRYITQLIDNCRRHCQNTTEYCRNRPSQND